mmetsp:Transcript_18180/g.52216  ORF Transcript_18180/g.52216 Transcript_18180/m.52216 type:complete len:238 (-) Transcript_18180:1104-1817(-)
MRQRRFPPCALETGRSGSRTSQRSTKLSPSPSTRKCLVKRRRRSALSGCIAARLNAVLELRRVLRRCACARVAGGRVSACRILQSFTLTRPPSPAEMRPTEPGRPPISSLEPTRRFPSPSRRSTLFVRGSMRRPSSLTCPSRLWRACGKKPGGSRHEWPQPLRRKPLRRVAWLSLNWRKSRPFSPRRKHGFPWTGSWRRISCFGIGSSPILAKAMARADRRHLMMGPVRRARAPMRL